MNKTKGTDEKRTLEIVDNYGKELEQVIYNPELLPEETYVGQVMSDSYKVDNYDYHSSSSHHHRSSHHHYSDSVNRYSGRPRDIGHSRHNRIAGTGRLASHHRSRHHHHHSDKTNETRNSYISAEETVNRQENIDGTPVKKAFLQAVNASYLDSSSTKTDSFNQTVDSVYSESYQEVEADLVPSNSNLKKYDGVSTDKECNYETESQSQYVYTAESKVVPVEKSRDEAVVRMPSADRNRRIASMASGSESSKRKMEKECEDSSVRKNNYKKSNHNHRKKIGFFGVLIRILIVFLVLGIIVISSLVYLRAHGENSMKKPVEEVQIVIPRDDSEGAEIEEVEDDGKTITYKGEKYRYNDNVSTILFMGTDRTNVQQERTETAIGINGQADTIILCVIDNTNQKISFINVNRDTMVPVSEYTPDGDYAGDKIMQICLAYSYGADNVQSSERMVDAVSKYLYGMPINAYCRLSYDGIPTLNDAVGGVTVIVPEDMTAVDPKWIEGTTITLHGEESATYIRYRNRDTVRTNEFRMFRQKQYLKAFMNQTMDYVRTDLSLPLTLYSIAAGYMTTDITTSQITYLSSKVLEYGIDDDAIISIPGQSVDGEDYVEFYSDDKGLYEIILNIFYNKE